MYGRTVGDHWIFCRVSFFSLPRYRVMSRKLVDSRLVSMVILSLCDLKGATGFVFILHVRGPGLHLWMASQPERRSAASKPCTCRVKSSCPVQGNCQASGIYKATVKANNKPATYIGFSNHFKKRYSTQNRFKHEKHTNATALSSFIWENGLNSTEYIEWEIIRTA